MDVTQVIRRQRDVVTAPPSLRAQVLLVVSAFLCGAVLAALLFVGIWRHTADDGARAHASQVALRHRLTASQHRLVTVTAQLAKAKGAASSAAATAARERRALGRATAANAALTRTLAPRLSALEGSAHGVESQVTTLQSELKTLGAYVAQPGATGLDAGYLSAQLDYITSAAKAAGGAAATIAQRAGDAGAALNKR